MKLKHFAVFVFRVLGALFMLKGLWTIILVADNGIGSDPAIKVFMIALIWGLLGGQLIYYSKVVARVFCKGIDDDSA